MQPQASGQEPFFLQVEPGQRFCLFHPAREGACRGAVLYLHPFADEMNKSRRMAALQARALAQAGIAVLQLDLYGCGDSSGEFVEARWDTWKADVAAGCTWLAGRLGVPVSLLGLRLGATLALDYARSASHPLDKLVLWQPVINGNLFLTQYLRLLTANAMLADNASAPASEKGESTSTLRKELLAGRMLEVAGYELAPALAQAIDTLDAAALVPPASVHWFDTGPAERPLAPPIARLEAGWRAAGVDLQVHRLPSTSFWNTQEIAEAPALVAATTALFQEA
jgi:exosortase A-associated hydrolase 2